MINTDAEAALSKITEFAALGMMSFSDRLAAFETAEDELQHALPWVPFGRDNSIICWPVPVMKEDRTGVLVVRATHEARFPKSEDYLYYMPDIDQQILSIRGTITVFMNERTWHVRPFHPFKIPKGTPASLFYPTGALAIFVNTPKIATKENELQFISTLEYSRVSDNSTKKENHE